MVNHIRWTIVDDVMSSHKTKMVADAAWSIVSSVFVELTDGRIKQNELRHILPVPFERRRENSRRHEHPVGRPQNEDRISR